MKRVSAIIERKKGRKGKVSNKGGALDDVIVKSRRKFVVRVGKWRAP